MKVVNSDDIYEKMLNDAGLETTPEDIYSDEGQEIRVRAKAGVTKRMQGNFLQGRLGLIIDGTGKDFDKISKQVAGLKQLGYECSMIFVNTSLDTAQERNKMRKRTLPEKQVEVMWNGVQQNMGKFRLFGASNMIIVDNNNAGEDVFDKVWKRCAMLIRKKYLILLRKNGLSQNLLRRDWVVRKLQLNQKVKK